MGRISSLPPDIPIYTTVVNYAELIHGAEKARNPEQEHQRVIDLLQRFTILSFEKEAAEIFGQERARLEREGLRISDLDLVIASIALQSNLNLVTHNLREMERVRGLKLDDWPR